MKKYMIALCLLFGLVFSVSAADVTVSYDGYPSGTLYTAGQGYDGWRSGLNCSLPYETDYGIEFTVCVIEAIPGLNEGDPSYWHLAATITTGTLDITIIDPNQDMRTGSSISLTVEDGYLYGTVSAGVDGFYEFDEFLW